MDVRSLDEVEQLIHQANVGLLILTTVTARNVFIGATTPYSLLVAFVMLVCCLASKHLLTFTVHYGTTSHELKVFKRKK
jgi:hypothetical protein